MTRHRVVAFTTLLLAFGCSEPDVTAVPATEAPGGSESAASESPDTDESENGTTIDSAGSEGQSEICGNGTVDDGEECDLGSLNTDNGVCTTQCTIAVCGDGFVLLGQELCDDGNVVDSDECTTACAQPTCDDGIWSGAETDIDCGGQDCGPCGHGLACESPYDCASGWCNEQVCITAATCFDLTVKSPFVQSGVYSIDPDGPEGTPAFDAYCEMTIGGGGWTLVMVSSDDGVNTWTWNNRGLMGVNTSIVGDVDSLNLDYKSRAYNRVLFRDLLFVHHPSLVWAEYDIVGDGTQNLGQHVLAVGSPICDAALGGMGYHLSDGTLTTNGSSPEGYVLCDTDLYFNLGDNDVGESCSDIHVGSQGGSYGPMWNTRNNGACPFDDPNRGALGPVMPGPTELPADVEVPSVGFGANMGLNIGAQGTGENYMHVFVR